MGATGKTSRGIPIFRPDDSTGWLDGFNPAMEAINKLFADVFKLLSSVGDKNEELQTTITEIQSKLIELSGLISSNSTDIEHLQNDVTTASGAAANAVTQADAALAAANSANDTAGEAISSASTAESTANAAQRTANTALTVANGALKPSTGFITHAYNVSGTNDLNVNSSSLNGQLQDGFCYLSLQSTITGTDISFELEGSGGSFANFTEGDPPVPVLPITLYDNTDLVMHTGLATAEYGTADGRLKLTVKVQPELEANSNYDVMISLKGLVSRTS